MERKRLDDKVLDLADQVMNEFDRLIVRFAKIALPVIVGIGLGYAWRMVQGF